MNKIQLNPATLGHHIPSCYTCQPKGGWKRRLVATNPWTCNHTRRRSYTRWNTRRRKFIHGEGMELALMSIQRFVTKSLFLSPFLFFFFEKECIYWAKAFLYYLKKEYYLKFWSRRENWNFDIFLIFKCDSLSRIFFINKNNRNIVNDIAWLTRYKEGRIFLFVNSKLLSTSYTEFHIERKELEYKIIVQSNDTIYL